MEKIVQYLNGLDFNVLVVILMTIFFSLERLLNSPHKFDKRFPHLLNNMVLGIAFILMNLVAATVQIAILQWGDAKHMGLFYQVEMPFWVKVVIGIAILDMSSYWTHRLSHRSPLLWRIHRVHHSDSTMDSSSYFRGHPFEAWVSYSPHLICTRCTITGNNSILTPITQTYSYSGTEYSAVINMYR